MTDIQKYKTVLEAEKITLENELATVGRRNPANPSDWEATPQGTGQEADLGDEAQLQEGYGDNQAILNDLELRLTSVTDALDRVQKNTYGVCGVCQNIIEEERLVADPTANTCIAHV